jgi:glycerol-3-phosphate acyltransferase PlsY
MIIAKFVGVVLASYLLGSIPFGLMITRKASGVDVRTIGSGKIGATNVLRVAGKKAAVLSLVLDLLKGTLAVLFAGLILSGDYMVAGNHTIWLVKSAQVLGAVVAVCGHKWSIFLKFKGGRGVATFFGGLAALSPVVALFGAEVLIIGAGLTRYMSLGSIAGVVGAYIILVPLTIFAGFPVEYLIYAFIGAIFIIIWHRDNISRLLAGTERRLGERVPVSDSVSSTNS